MVLPTPASTAIPKPIPMLSTVEIPLPLVHIRKVGGSSPFSPTCDSTATRHSYPSYPRSPRAPNRGPSGSPPPVTQKNVRPH